MAYYENATLNQTPPVERSSLITDSSRLTDSLSEIHSRVVKLGEALHGAHPRDAGAKANVPEPTPTIRRNLDRALDLAASILKELSQIENLV